MNNKSKIQIIFYLFFHRATLSSFSLARPSHTSAGMALLPSTPPHAWAMMRMPTWPSRCASPTYQRALLQNWSYMTAHHCQFLMGQK